MLSGTGKSQLLQVFKEIQGQREDSFSTSLPYYLLTGRKGCKVYTDGQATVIVALHPHVDDKLLIFPEVNGNFELTVKVLNQLAQKGLNVQLARYTEEDFQKLNTAIEKDRKTTITSIKLVPEDILDWKYPAHILDTAKVAYLSGKEFTKLRRAFNRASAIEGIEITPLQTEEDILKMRGSIMIWAGLMIAAGKENGHDLTEFYDTLVKQITDFPSIFGGFVITKDREPVGFTIWDTVNKTANALASLSRRSLRDLSEFQLITACRILNEKGIKRLNLGGSEIPELDNFKLKFRPIDSIELNSYDVEYDKFDFMGIDEITVVPDNQARLDI